MTIPAAALIPSYNEAKTIGGIVTSLKEKGLTVYVVDDGSADRTGPCAEAGGARVITHERNEGKGASLKEGFARILRDGFRYVLVMDGDGQHHLEDTPAFFTAMEETGAGIVIGNRMADVGAMPRLRVVINASMSWLISKTAGQYIPDTQCGFRLIRREVLEGMRLDSSNYETESELLIRAALKGWKIVSVPIKTIYRGEASGIRPVRDTWRFILLMVRLWGEGKR